MDIYNICIAYCINAYILRSSCFAGIGALCVFVITM